ncbi:MAG: MBL fold metallo-hydrolase [Steroidobacteraceae bacterium]
MTVNARSVLLAALAAAAAPAGAQQMGVDNPLRTGQDQQAAIRVNDSIYLALGFGNTFMVTTSAGNVIIDTSSAPRAPRAKELLQRENAGPVKYIVLTHAHGDHTGGVNLWKAADTEVIAQRQHYEFVNYQTRLAGFFAERNAAQFAFPRPQTGAWAGNYGAQLPATILFDDQYEITVGDTKLELYSTPGETPDHLTVWIPKYKAAFVGDNYYESFPNIYTLRGTTPRWAHDYVSSLNKVLALEPEILLPSHGPPIRGMNEGKDVFSLMQEIKPPPELNVGESYGNLIWSIRGIYEGYAGWFDMRPATMYEIPASAVFPDVTRLAGGPDAIAKLAAQRVESGKYVEALHLTEMALAADPKHRPALEARLAALERLLAQSQNSNERGWLNYSIRQTRAKL